MEIRVGPADKMVQGMKKERNQKLFLDFWVEQPSDQECISWGGPPKYNQYIVTLLAPLPLSINLAGENLKLGQI